MSCEHVGEMLSAYLDNMLAADERRNVAEHLLICAPCNTLLLDFRRFDRLIADLPRVSPPPHLRSQLLCSLLVEPATHIPSDVFPGIFAEPEQTTSHIHPAGRQQLIVLPGGRDKETPTLKNSDTQIQTLGILATSQSLDQKASLFQMLMVMLILLLVMGIGMILGWQFWIKQNNSQNSGSLNAVTMQISKTSSHSSNLYSPTLF